MCVCVCVCACYFLFRHTGVYKLVYFFREILTKRPLHRVIYNDASPPTSHLNYPGLPRTLKKMRLDLHESSCYKYYHAVSDTIFGLHLMKSLRNETNFNDNHRRRYKSCCLSCSSQFSGLGRESQVCRLLIAEGRHNLVKLYSASGL